MSWDDVPAEIALHLQIGIDVVAQPGHLLVGEVPDPGVGAGLGGRTDPLGGGPADAEDVGEGDLQPLLAGDVHAGDSGHVASFSLTPGPRASALPLLVARVLADHDDPPVPADHFALFTHRLDTRSNLHCSVLRPLPPTSCSSSYCRYPPWPACAPRRCRCRSPGRDVTASSGPGAEPPTCTGR